VAQIKIPTRQNAISRQPCEIFIPKFLGLCGRAPATILKFKKKLILVFSKVMVSVGVCFGGKGRLHLIPDKTKVNAKLYVETLLPDLV